MNNTTLQDQSVLTDLVSRNGYSSILQESIHSPSHSLNPTTRAVIITSLLASVVPLAACSDSQDCHFAGSLNFNTPKCVEVRRRDREQGTTPTPHPPMAVTSANNTRGNYSTSDSYTSSPEASTYQAPPSRRESIPDRFRMNSLQQRGFPASEASRLADALEIIYESLSAYSDDYNTDYQDRAVAQQFINLLNRCTLSADDLPAPQSPESYMAITLETLEIRIKPHFGNQVPELVWALVHELNHPRTGKLDNADPELKRATDHGILLIYSRQDPEKARRDLSTISASREKVGEFENR